MRVCVTQRRGIRYFTKFTHIGERDKLEVELRIEDKDNQVVLIDLTTALMDAYADHPEIGKVNPVSIPDAAASQTPTPIKIKRSKTVSPAYLSESKKDKDKLIAKVREAQLEAAEQNKKKKAEFAKARAERLANAREVKAKKEAARKASAAKKTAAGKAAGASKKNATAKTKKPAASKKTSPKLTKAQQTAVKEIGKALASKDKGKT